MPPNDTLAPFVRKLAQGLPLAAADQAAVLALSHRARRLYRLDFVEREGTQIDRSSILLSGFAFSSKTCASGGRAVLALHMDGDPLDIMGCSDADAVCDVQALTEIEVADVSRAELYQVAHDHPRIGQALWRLTARSASVLGEWLTSVGRRDARGRISHLICEIAARQRALGAETGAAYVMPLTQEQLADSTGLTSVHVNRVLQRLRRERLISYDKREMNIMNWDGLRRAGDFSPGYLRLT